MPSIILNEFVTIGGVVLATPAFKCTNWMDLYGDPPLEGDDVTLLGVAGVDPQARKAGPLRAVLPILVYGEKDQDGVTHADPRLGLKTNLTVLKGLTEEKAGDGTQTLRLTFKDASFVEADCTVHGGLPITHLTPTAVRTTLDVTLPDGALF